MRHIIAAFIITTLAAHASPLTTDAHRAASVQPTTCPTATPATPQDALQACAAKALAGGYGPLPKWKSDAYKLVLAKHLTVQGRAKTTTYCPCCDSSAYIGGTKYIPGVTCAANPEIPRYSIVWLQTVGMLRVTDRGGAVKITGKYVRRGETANFDRFVEHCEGGCWTGPGTVRNVPYAVIGVAK